ncbi:MAG: 2-amino-4-hydroxy-6-hydroxymethyldihydropteridine diphosphokinase, partial [Verrucomicrobiota bacterium]
RLQELEREFGRRPKVVLNEARSLDLDLIAWGPELQTRPELTLPHPRAHQRRFVLAPLAEVDPGRRLPGLPAPADALLEALRTDEVLFRLEPSAG